MNKNTLSQRIPQVIQWKSFLEYIFSFNYNAVDKCPIDVR